jgi:hypothetical protein
MRVLIWPFFGWGLGIHLALAVVGSLWLYALTHPSIGCVEFGRIMGGALGGGLFASFVGWTVLDSTFAEFARRSFRRFLNPSTEECKRIHECWASPIANDELRFDEEEALHFGWAFPMKISATTIHLNSLLNVEVTFSDGDTRSDHHDFLGFGEMQWINEVSESAFELEIHSDGSVDFRSFRNRGQLSLEEFADQNLEIGKIVVRAGLYALAAEQYEREQERVRAARLDRWKVA